MSEVGALEFANFLLAAAGIAASAVGIYVAVAANLRSTMIAEKLYKLERSKLLDSIFIDIKIDYYILESVIQFTIKNNANSKFSLSEFSFTASHNYHNQNVDYDLVKPYSTQVIKELTIDLLNKDSKTFVHPFDDISITAIKQMEFVLTHDSGQQFKVVCIENPEYLRENIKQGRLTCIYKRILD